MKMINKWAGLVNYWSSRKNAEFVPCEVQVVKKQHTSTEEQTLTQHLPVCWLSFCLCFCHFPSLRLLHLHQRALSPSQRGVSTVVPLLPVDGDQGKQCLFLLVLRNSSHASFETGSRPNSTVEATTVGIQSSCGWWRVSAASSSFRMKRPTTLSSDRWKFCRAGSDKLSLTRSQFNSSKNRVVSYSTNPTVPFLCRVSSPAAQPDELQTFHAVNFQVQFTGNKKINATETDCNTLLTPRWCFMFKLLQMKIYASVFNDLWSVFSMESETANAGAENICVW